MKVVTTRMALGSVALPLLIFAACAAGNEASGGHEDVERKADGGLPDLVQPDAGDAGDARGPGAPPSRCSDDFCLVDLPNAAAYGFTDWIFAGVHVAPILGAWAIANGVYTVDTATVQLMRFEDGGWKPVFAPALGEGAGKRSIELYSMTSEAPGKLIAVGATLDDATPVIVRGDGTTFTTTVFDKPLSAVWSNAQGETWIAGAQGGIFRSDRDGGLIQETTDANGDFESIWGTGPEDLYVGGKTQDPALGKLGYVGHRTAGEAGAPTWTFRSVSPDLLPWGDPIVLAGAAAPTGARFWASPNGLVRVTPSSSADEDWAADPYQPRVPLRAFLTRSKDEIWAVGHVGRITRFDGTAWKNVRLVYNDAPLTAHLIAIAETAAGEIFVVGEGVALQRKAK